METVRVQSVASASAVLGEIPPEFVMSVHEQPGKTTFYGAAPPVLVVDMARPELAVHAIAEASRDWGIFLVVNHGIPKEVIIAMQEAGREFFELPPEEKEAYAVVAGSGSQEGYSTQFDKDLEGKKSWVDFLFYNVWPPAIVDYGIWPKKPASYRKATEEYSKYMVGLVDEIFAGLSMGLGLDKHVLKEAVGGEELRLMFKMNYYPPCPRPDLALGITPHTDMSTITILVPNDVPGLQIFHDDRWIDVDCIPNAFVVHIGDQIEILSNGRYKSLLHRTTVNKEKARMSWPVFCEPPDEMEIGPLPQLVSDEDPAKYKVKRFKDYKYCKINKLPQ